jgi:hypothetical protein
MLLSFATLVVTASAQEAQKEANQRPVPALAGKPNEIKGQTISISAPAPAVREIDPKPTGVPHSEGSPSIEEKKAPPELEDLPNAGAKSQRKVSQQDLLPMPDEEEERQAVRQLDGDETSKQAGPPCVSCPKTIVLEAKCGQKTSPDPHDFPSLEAKWIEPNFCGKQHDRQVRHTFQLPGCKQGKCCQICKAKLVVKCRSLLPGQSQSSSDAGNDKIYIMKNGQTLYAQHVYNSWPFSAGNTVTLTIPLQPSWFDGCRLSVLVQDDTSVESMKLVVTGCCVTPNVKP